MSRASREKGARGEREVASVFRDAGLPDVVRTPNSGGLHIPGDLVGVDGLHVEVKRAERLDIPAWLQQARADCPEGSTPVLAFRRSREEWQAVVPLGWLAELISQTQEG